MKIFLRENELLREAWREAVEDPGVSVTTGPRWYQLLVEDYPFLDNLLEKLLWLLKRKKVSSLLFELETEEWEFLGEALRGTVTLHGGPGVPERLEVYFDVDEDTSFSFDLTRWSGRQWRVNPQDEGHLRFFLRLCSHLAETFPLSVIERDWTVRGKLWGGGALITSKVCRLPPGKDVALAVPTVRGGEFFRSS